ncbi:MAG TPA: amino acid ABC transporter permease [Thermoanaerobacterales bacterium]|uniref:amino acid ABC transporter permease n=1 Tax=Tepidanaerobacter sp. GT38 TaxID=2722793 RepID=UPI00184C7650|nr:amino acid ABC transporter permease [Tepidanaerobacter sp. GT38]MCG1012544.1 amino acid ABC transporter permease [Tepidanaerobacter sp. GT38]HHY42840.1 amino acid ABC transporter permease [Thermoanaerobacterales bacterium]
MAEYIIRITPALLAGLDTTLSVFFLTLVLSIPLGILVALGRLSNIRPLVEILKFYIWVMRGTPLLLQIVVIFFGLPIIGITFDRFPAAILAFVLNYAAYFGEIFRGGIDSIDKGQYDAAKVLGFTPAKTYQRIILPQMIKIVLPSVANEVITLVKDTSLVYVVGLGELLRAGKIASNRDASLVPLIMAGVFYLALTGILTVVFQKLEKRYAYYQ